MTTTNQLTAAELQDRDPRRFREEYYEWLRFFADDFWRQDSQFIIDHFQEEMMEKFDLRVDDVTFTGDYAWDAAIAGRLDLADLLVHLDLKDRYLPLWYEFYNYGAYLLFDYSGHRSPYQRVAVIEFAGGNCRPDGVFSDMPQEAWDALIAEQFDAEDWEELALKWVTTHNDELASRLGEEYDHATSEEEFIAHCEANEITFEIGDDDEVQD
jgi:hypothetical protein